jgi:regulator of sigma E protease
MPRQGASPHPGSERKAPAADPPDTVPSDFIYGLFTNVKLVALVVLFFGGSIFVHELGHFLAARWRGVRATRFSIGFGPKIFGWRGRDGVEYRLSWLPLGGYVALPQLADMRAIEGESESGAERLPPVDYLSKMIVFVAGAAFNVLFAFALACIIWIAGFPEADDLQTTQVGVVYPTLSLADGTEVPSPASRAGLQVGDTIRAIDGRPVNDWNQLRESLLLGSGRTEDRRPRAVLSVERAGAMVDIVVEPVLAGQDNVRQIGISPVEDYALIVGEAPEESLGKQIGFEVGDTILSLDATLVRNITTFQSYLIENRLRPVVAGVARGDETLSITIPPRPEAVDRPGLNLQFTTSYHYVYPTPLAQVSEHVGRTFRTLASLINPQTDIGLSQVSGPVGIVHIFYAMASEGIRFVLWFTILININLAIFNLLPIPVLDGGHMLFATIGKVLGKPLPANLIMTAQSVFMMLLFSMILYVSFFDVRRVSQQIRSNNPPAQAPAEAGSEPAAQP